MTENNKDQFVPFDWSLYGTLIRKRRIDLGYKKAEAFTQSIWRRTRVAISRDTLYKIEQGRQTPDATQFMAINIALGGDPFFPWATSLCLSVEWREIREAFKNGSPPDDSLACYEEPVSPSCPYVPYHWRRDNAEEAAMSHPECFASEKYLSLGDIICRVNDSPSLFASIENPLFEKSS